MEEVEDEEENKKGKAGRVGYWDTRKTDEPVGEGVGVMEPNEKKKKFRERKERAAHIRMSQLILALSILIPSCLNRMVYFSNTAYYTHTTHTAHTTPHHATHRHTHTILYYKQHALYA